MSDQSSILNTIKEMVLGDCESKEFDRDILVAINSAISTLYQIGIESLNAETGEGFTVTGEDEQWADYLGDFKFLDMVKGYIYQRVRLMFDPPQNSFLVNAIQDSIKETEWRITVAVETDNAKNKEEVQNE